MPSRDAFASQLLTLYRTQVREFLVDNLVADVGPLDQNAELLERALGQSGELKVGFIGESQVGKSTLINALLDRRALPSGGIGPLTAQATRVVYADENGLSATYHGKGQLHRHAFAIARYLERRGDIPKQGKDGKLPPDDDVASVTDDAAAADRLLSAVDAPEDGGRKDDLGRHMLNQARRILEHRNLAIGDAKGSDALLLDGLREILGQKPLGDPAALEPYRARIDEVRAILGTSESISESSEGGNAQFNKALYARAAGWRSPLVAELRLFLRSETLRSLTLVDLPGIGVLDDPAGKEAEKFVRTEGDALVVVLRQNGITEAVADLLERTGVVTKILFGGKAEVPPVQVVFVVTHLDDVARDHYSREAQEARENGDPLPDRNGIFARLATEMSHKLRDMLNDALRRSKAFDDLSAEQRAAREAAVASIVKNMEVFCPASPDYLSLKEDEGEALFLRDAEATRIPDMRRHLRHLADSAADRRQETIRQFEISLRSAISEHLTSIARMYEEGRGAATQEFERFRDSLMKAAEPLRNEMQAYHGETLGVLRKGMGAELELLAKEAEIAAQKRLRRTLREGEALHFASLRAALLRNGVWERRGVNYPDAITLAFVDSVASQWEPRVIEKVREEVKSLAARDLRLVERLCDAATSTNPKLAADAQLESQRRILQTNSKTAVAWTKEQLEELRSAVSRTLRQCVQKPIDAACEAAVRSGEHYGTGAKRRILDAFEAGGEAAIEQARNQALALLKKHYEALLRRLNEGFLRDNHDPVTSALEAMTGEQVTRARRADAQRKRIVTARVNEIGSALNELVGPSLTAANSWHPSPTD